MTAAPTIVTAAEQPDLVEAWWEATKHAFPEYNSHGDVLNEYWGRLVPERGEFQLYLLDGDVLLVRACTIPVRWDGTVEDLPAGIDGAIARGFEEDGANTLCALLAAVVPAHRRGGLSRLALGAMASVARANGFRALIAPVRPSWKERYPLTPIERYAAWRRADGLFFDPWMRVHERLGADVLRPEPRSLRITGTVAEWEEWTEMAFPESGDYVFPGCLAPVVIDRETDLGSYWEPNVWMRHTIA